MRLGGVVDVIRIVPDTRAFPTHPFLPVCPRIPADAGKPFQIVRQVVVELTELGIRHTEQGLIREVDLLEIRGAVVAVTDIGVVLKREASVRFLDLMLTRARLDAQSGMGIPD